MTFDDNRLTPTARLSTRSQQLSQHIYHEICNTKMQCIPFARFMALALFNPSLGYYNGSSTVLGPQGDFTTAPEIAATFSQCLARYCQSILTAFPKGEAVILEIGAGTGRMAADILTALARLDCLPARYYIMEISPVRVAQQKANLKQWVPHVFDRIQHVETVPDHSIQGVILANEVMDVLPVHLFEIQDGQCQERYVGYAQGQFVWKTGDPSSKQLGVLLSEIQQHYLQSVEHYCSEVNLSLDAWLQSLKNFLKAGCVLLSDYGYAGHEYYHVQRTAGTLRCYYRHRLRGDPLSLVGLQDITSHVNFTQVAHIATKIGFKLEGFVSQAAFLLVCGLLELERPCYTHLSYLQMRGRIHQLCSPNEMGELCKVMVLSHNFKGHLLSLTEYDRRAWL